MPLASLLFDEDFLRRLEMLRLALVRQAGARGQSPHLSGAGEGTGEFREHRDYSPGDEPRYIDWNIYGRLDKLFLKQFSPEREGRVLVLLDVSASMAAGSRGGEKFNFARRLAAAVAYVALAGADRVTLLAFDAEKALALTPKPGPAGLYEIFAFMESLKAAGATGYRPAAARVADASGSPGRGAAVWISDFWTDPAAWGDIAAAAGSFDGVLVRILSPEESDPPQVGSLVLVDAETGQRLSVAGGPEAAGAFRRTADGHAAALDAFAVRHGMRPVVADSSSPFEGAVMELLHRGRLVEPF